MKLQDTGDTRFLLRVLFWPCLMLTRLQLFCVQVKHSIDCRPVTSNKCKDIDYQECKEEPIEDCKTHDVMIPMQELVHKKKCLLPDIRASGAADDFVDVISPRGIEPDLVIFYIIITPRKK